MKKVIVVSAHPDDEVLGVGGTLLKHKKNNDEIHWLIVTGLLKEEGFSGEKISSRNKEIEIVASMLGVKKTYKLDYPSMKLTDKSLITLIPAIGEIFQECQPEIIYVVNSTDAHSDHRITFLAVSACTKSFRYPFVKQTYMYECISETEFALGVPSFTPNYFVDISEFMDEKLKLMEVYASELAEHPFPRSLTNIKALATFRGASCGVMYAESFQLLKGIDK